MTDTAELAAYACTPESSRGRLVKEPHSPTRSDFQRDRDRIIHSRAFRRLQYKTQVFVFHEGDHYRTRLTHSIEVAQIARSICRQLGLNEDLAETLALAHDLGHTPFGHAGEDALDEVMAPYGGFDHNEQTFRHLTLLEERYYGFDGLNLTWETLEGIVKHNGPVSGARPTVAKYNESWDLELDTHASAEAQVAALSDDIAYNNHDIDDGLRAGLFTMDDLKDVPLVGEVFAEAESRADDNTADRLKHEAVRRLINAMVHDVLRESRKRIEKHKPGSAEAVRQAGEPLIAFSVQMRNNERALRDFLFNRMYRHYKVNRMTSKARRVVKELFVLYMEEPECLPDLWQSKAKTGSDTQRARHVADYIAGMTDRFALDEHRKIFDVQSKTQ
ncbi:MAG: deoxyguanosinetriphosphate triphosphohydrolase [Rhodovibrionaceae bacterium]